MVERMTASQFKALMAKEGNQNVNYGSGAKNNANADTSTGNKYRNRRVRWEGTWRGKQVVIVFGSQKECRRGIELMHLESSGYIKDLSFQKQFLLVPSFRDERSVTYKSDSYYFDNELKKWVIEDTKSETTRKEPRYVIKRKLVKYQNQDHIFREV